jgi:hypothetical protein
MGNKQSSDPNTPKSFEYYNTFFKQKHKQWSLNKIVAEQSIWIQSGEPYIIFVLKAKDKWNLRTKLTRGEKQYLDSKEETLLDPQTIITFRDIDLLWSLYRATGDELYSNRVKEIVKDEKQDIKIRAAAQYSYLSHVKNKLVNDGQYYINYVSGVEENVFKRVDLVTA